MNIAQIIQKHFGLILKSYAENKISTALIILIFLEALFFDELAQVEFFAKTASRLVLFFITTSCILFTSTLESYSLSRNKIALVGNIVFHMIICLYWVKNISDRYLWIQIPFFLANLLFFHKSILNQNDLVTWEWQNRFSKSIAEAIFICIIYTIAAFLLMYIIGFVFDIDAIKIADSFILKSATTLIFFSIFLLRKSIKREALNRFSENIVKYAVSPLWAFYVVLLNIYVLKIVINWSLPKGMVAVPISIAFIAFSLKWWLLIPVKGNENNKSSNALLWSQIILLGLFYVGAGRRLVDYGITQPRYFLVLLSLLYTGIVYMSIKKLLTGRRFSILILILTILSFVNVA